MRNQDGEIHKAAKQGDLAQLKCLLAQDPSLLEAPGWMGTRPLCEAASSGSLECVNFLLDQGADVNAVGEDNGVSAIFQSKTGEIASRLVEAGARLDLVSARKRVALDYACSHLLVDVVRVMLANGADPAYSKPVDKFRTMMQWAIGEIRLVPEDEKSDKVAAVEEIVQLLLVAGAPVNELNAYDCTALHTACAGGLIGVVQLLLEHGADPHLRDSGGNTAFELGKQYPEITALLAPYGPEKPAPPKPPQTPQQLIDRLIACGEIEESEMIPCSEDDIAWLESTYDIILPESYKLFLRKMGRGAGDFLVDDHFEAFFETFEWEIEKGRRHHGGNVDPESLPKGVELPPKHFVFADRNGYFYMYFNADGTDDDPPIYAWLDDGPEGKKFDTFWGFIEEMVEYYEFYKDPKRFSQDDQWHDN